MSQHPLVEIEQKLNAQLSDVFRERFVLCPLIGTEQDYCWVEALAGDRVPVVMSDAFELPHIDQVDYAASLFLVGCGSTELAHLGVLEHIPDDTYQRMVNAGKQFYGQFFENGGWEPVLPMPDHPALLKDGCLLGEADFLQAMWKQLAGRVLVFGAGKYLRRLVDALGGQWHGVDVIGIADDSVMATQSMCGIPLAGVDYYSRSDFDIVFLATDSMENRFIQRVHALFGAATPFIKPVQKIKALDDVTWSYDLNSYQLCVEPLVQVERLEALTVCLGYADFLSWTLPENVKLFDQFVVVTSSEDRETQTIAKRCGATVVVSDVYKEDGATFNKGKMINAGLKALSCDGWLMITDADIFIDSLLRRRLSPRLLNPKNLYYATRFNTPEQCREKWMMSYINDPSLKNDLPFWEQSSDQMPWGYFQLLYGPNVPLYPERYQTAGTVDYEYQTRWPMNRRILLPETVVHISHGIHANNWAGRISETLQKRNLDL